MVVEQVSVFVENKPGRLSKVTEVLGEAGINIRALSIAELGEFGVIRLVVDKPHEARAVLTNSGFTVGINRVLAIEMGDEPGSLAKIASALGNAGVNIDYAYAFIAGAKEKAVLIARVDDIRKAEDVLSREGIRLLAAEELQGI
ncbi:ACT domain-containing protein [Candidatus Pyrohabitans sp.]